MHEMTMIRARLMNKLDELRTIKLQMMRNLKKAPKGKLVLSGSNGTIQYFHKTDNSQKNGEYISKKNQKLIRALAQKDYDERLLKLVEKQEKQVVKAMKSLPDKGVAEIYEDLSENRKKLVIPFVISDEEYVKQWQDVQYIGKEFPDERPGFATERGETVRSKSEKMIADKLYTMGIPYRYEYPLYLKNFGTVYPDFTLLNIQTREEIYLEHFGMMDYPEYSRKAILKIEEYARNDIFLGKNLILTFETLQTPFDARNLEKLLKASIYIPENV